MSARSVSYPPSGYLVRIPEAIWHGALDTMREYASIFDERGKQGSEALVFLGGVVAADDQVVVTGLYRLNHAPQGDRVAVTPEEARWLLRALNVRDEKLVGQLHSHRGRAGHSPGDDMWATSFHEGFLSIVVPFFGREVTTPTQCAVLEYTAGRFVELDQVEVERRIETWPLVSSRAGVLRREEGGARWRAFVRKLKSIVHKRP